LKIYPEMNGCRKAALMIVLALAALAPDARAVKPNPDVYGAATAAAGADAGRQRPDAAKKNPQAASPGAASRAGRPN